MSPMPPSVQSLLDRHPVMSTEAMLAHFVPPAQFRNASLDNYVPNPDFPSQAQALEKAREFVRPVAASPSGWKRLGKSSSRSSVKPGIYLDGGFGVGKTHLLAAMWHQIPGRTYYGTFIEFTALVGVLGYRGAVDHLRGAQLLAIDEFELDDPGDTMVMSRLLQELVASGTRLAATSNTPPAALGEGRFAAEDFLREITALSDKFETIRIDGEDYRKRDVDEEAVVVANADLDEAVSHQSFQMWARMYFSYQLILIHSMFECVPLMRCNNSLCPNRIQSSCIWMEIRQSLGTQHHLTGHCEFV